MPMSKAMPDYEKVQPDHTSCNSTTESITQLPFCLHNGAPATAEAAAPSPAPSLLHHIGNRQVKSRNGREGVKGKEFLRTL